MLERIEEFVRRYANPSVRKDLRVYAEARAGISPPDPKPLRDGIAFAAHSLTHALTADRRRPARA